MFDNPFTPVFGGKPDFFFGRTEILARFDRALAIRGSEDRVLFVTGTRGSGKTALAEQLAMRAEAKGWAVFDVLGEPALPTLFRQLQPQDEVSSTTDPSVSISVLGSGGSISGKASTKTAHYTIDDFDGLLLRTCEKQRQGVFILVDEIQKTPIEDVSRLCAALQHASKKGMDIILVAAGLPASHEAIIHHDGCTFMRRSVHEELSLFDRQECRTGFLKSIERIQGLQLENEATGQLVSLSMGHPYMMQLLGYHLVEYLNGTTQGPSHSISLDDVDRIAPVALEAYERRALKPLVDELSDNERAYLKAMGHVMDERHNASTGAIARYLQKSGSSLTSNRQALIDLGVIVPSDWGKVRFSIPYLRQYLQKDPDISPALRRSIEWDV